MSTNNSFNAEMRLTRARYPPKTAAPRKFQTSKYSSNPTHREASNISCHLYLLAVRKEVQGNYSTRDFKACVSRLTLVTQSMILSQLFQHHFNTQQGYLPTKTATINLIIKILVIKNLATTKHHLDSNLTENVLPEIQKMIKSSSIYQ